MSRSIHMNRFVSFLIALVLLCSVVLWVYSHADPEAVGSCKRVVVNFGSSPTVNECQPYGVADFGVPLGAVLILLLLGTDGDVTVKLLGFTVSRQRRVEGAADDLADAAPTLTSRWESGKR